METIYDTARQRQDVQPALADALTRVLFSQMQALGIAPPTHAADGLPKPAARQGYAALAQTLMAIRGGRSLPTLAAQIAQASPGGAVREPEEPPSLEAYGSRRRGPDVVTITVEGRPYYVSGGDFETMKEAVKAYAQARGVAPRNAWDVVGKTWKVPGTLAELEAALDGRAFRVTEEKPLADDAATGAAARPAAPGGEARSEHSENAPDRSWCPPSGTPSAPGGSDRDARSERGEGEADAGEPSRYRMRPADPPGDVPPAALNIIRRAMRDASTMARVALLDFANGQSLGSSEAAVNSLLRTIAEELRSEFGRKRTDLPLIYWARQSNSSPAKRHAMAVAVLSALPHPRCATCGQWMPGKGSRRTHSCPVPTFGADGYNGFGVDRYGITRWGTTRDGLPLPRRRTVMEAAKDFITLSDPINNPTMADLWGRIASGVAGHDCRVILREGGGFATDMQGTIYADPYPLGHDADPRHNMIVTKAGIYHEIGHELTTPPEDWAYLLEVAAARETIPGIDQSRAMITKIYNIIEDGRHGARHERPLWGRR